MTELVLVDAETGEELNRIEVDQDQLDRYDVGIAYKHQHLRAKWSGWVLASHFDSDPDVLDINYAR